MLKKSCVRISLFKPSSFRIHIFRVSEALTKYTRQAYSISQKLEFNPGNLDEFESKVFIEGAQVHPHSSPRLLVPVG